MFNWEVSVFKPTSGQNFQTCVLPQSKLSAALCSKLNSFFPDVGLKTDTSQLNRIHTTQYSYKGKTL